MKRKKYLSVIIFLVLFTLCLNYLNKVYTSYDAFSNTIEDYNKLTKKTNVDLLFFGSSYTYRIYNPLIFDYKCKTISYNLGSVALRTKITNIVLEEALKQTNPKLIVLEAKYNTMAPIKNERGKGYQLIALDFVTNTSIKKAVKINSIYNYNEYLGVYNNLIRNHENWHKVKYKNLSRKIYFNQKTKYFYHGFRGSTKFMGNSESIINLNDRIIKQDTTKSFLNKTVKNYFDDILNIAKSNNIPVLVITPPYIDANNYHYHFNELNSYFTTKQNVTYLNLNNYYNEIDLTTDDFMDWGHLNIYGSSKTSLFLANYINNNYNLPNRTNDELWKSTTKEYPKFIKQYVTEKMKFEMFLDFKIKPNLKIKYVKFIKKGNNYNLFLKIDAKNNNSNYKLNFRIYPKESDYNSLSIYSKKINRKFDVINNEIPLNDSILSFTYNSKIKNIKKIELFFQDKNNSLIGNKLILDNMIFKN